MHPQYHNENYLPTLYNIEKGFFLSECRALHSLGDSGYVPKYVTHAEGKQGEDGPYPGGFLFVLVRSRLEGTFIRRSEERRRAPFSLSAEEMQYIKGEIVKAHEYVCSLLSHPLVTGYIHS